MKTLIKTLALAPLVALALAACASGSNHSKPGFYTEVIENRLWVFQEGSKELASFQKVGLPAVQYTKIGAGPGGMTMKSANQATLDAYIAAK